jgi:hypothetical protein
VNQATISPEQHLWLAVIERAFEDAVTPSVKSKGRQSSSKNTVRDISRAEAARWFAEGSEDFQLVCNFAGLEPAWVQRLAHRKLKLKGVRL